jgi:hypothetical protein
LYAYLIHLFLILIYMKKKKGTDSVIIITV